MQGTIVGDGLVARRAISSLLLHHTDTTTCNISVQRSLALQSLGIVVLVPLRLNSLFVILRRAATGAKLQR